MNKTTIKKFKFLSRLIKEWNLGLLVILGSTNLWVMTLMSPVNTLTNLPSMILMPASANEIQGKVEKILKGSLDSILSPLLSVKIQIMSGKVCLRCKSKTLLGIVNKLLKTKSLLTSPSNVLPD